jgi:hypothetical protein
VSRNGYNGPEGLYTSNNYTPLSGPRSRVVWLPPKKAAINWKIETTGYDGPEYVFWSFAVSTNFFFAF